MFFHFVNISYVEVQPQVGSLRPPTPFNLPRPVTYKTDLI
jgi:hypothetical protein